MSLSRADRSGFAAWWWTIDRVALGSIGALIVIGLMLAFAASPAATGGPFSTGDFRFAAKQIAFADHAGDMAVQIQDRRAADAVVDKNSSDLSHGHVGCDRYDVAGHDIGWAHGKPPERLGSFNSWDGPVSAVSIRTPVSHRVV